MLVMLLLKFDDMNFFEKNVLFGNFFRFISFVIMLGICLFVLIDWLELGFCVELNVGRICKVVIDFFFFEVICKCKVEIVLKLVLKFICDVICL